MIKEGSISREIKSWSIPNLCVIQIPLLQCSWFDHSFKILYIWPKLESNMNNDKKKEKINYNWLFYHKRWASEQIIGGYKRMWVTLIFFIPYIRSEGTNG